MVAASCLHFGAIHAYPPCLYGNQCTWAATGNHYGGMTVDEFDAPLVDHMVADDGTRRCSGAVAGEGLILDLYVAFSLG